MYGIDYEGLNIQDKFEIGSGPNEIYTKWIAIKTIYKIQILTLIMEKFISTILVVRGAAAFLNNVYPWFVASGKEGRNTDSSPKLIQTNSTNAWSDFPRDRNGQVYYGG